MRFVAFDIESAVTVRNHSDMCAFGYAVADEDLNIIEEGEITIRPRKVTKFLQEKLGVTMDDLKDAPVFRQVYGRIIGILEHPDQVLFAHSADSDLRFLGRECRKNGLRTPYIEVYDTKEIYPRYTGADKVSLESTGEWSGAEFRNHKASEDARACLFIPKRIFEIEGREGFRKLMEGYRDTVVTTKDADAVLDLEDRRSRSDRVFSKKYQMAVRPKGECMKGLTVSMSKNIVNKCPEIVEEVGRMVLMNSGRVSKDPGAADIHVVEGHIYDNGRIQTASGGRKVVRMNRREICDAMKKGNVRSEMSRFRRSCKDRPRDPDGGKGRP